MILYIYVYIYIIYIYLCVCHIPLNPSVKENPGAKKPLPRLPAQGHRGSPNHRSPPQSPEDHCCSNHEASASHNTRTSRNSGITG